MKTNDKYKLNINEIHAVVPKDSHKSVMTQLLKNAMWFKDAMEDSIFKAKLSLYKQDKYICENGSDKQKEDWSKEYIKKSNEIKEAENYMWERFLKLATEYYEKKEQYNERN